MKALEAEGIPAGIRQGFILPEMTVFQAQNAYGRELSYDPSLFPMARKHCDTHFGMTVPLRAPNDESAAKLVSQGFQKVFEHIGDLDIEVHGA